MNLKLLKEVLLIAITIYGLYTGLSVYRTDVKNIINRLFFLLTIFSLFWIGFSFFGGIVNGHESSLILKRLNFAMLIPFFSSSFIFSIYYPKITARRKKVEIFMVVLSVLGFLISTFTSWVVENIKVEAWGNNVVGGHLFYSFNIVALIFTILIFYNLINKYSKLSRLEKSRVLYLMIGASIYAILNIIFNIILPIVSNSYKFDFIGDSSIIFFIGFTAYAILKHKLFNVKIVATEVTVISLSLGLFIQIFISNSAIEYILKFVVWILASYGGWQLIKSVKQEIKQREELELLAKKLEEANKHLKELDGMKDDFLSMASHELNTPLAAIEGYLSMILDEGMGGKLQPQTREYLDRIFSSSQRLSAIVKDLLNVSRIESGRIHLIYAEMQVEDIIKQSVSEIDPKIKEKKHTVCLELPTTPLPKSWMDATRITEVVLNLLGNAIKYTEDGGHIEIGAKQEDKNILVWVKDDGKGIPKDKADKVFQKFTQVDVLKDEVKGTGLGMYISQKFVELHNGKIWFQSDGDGKGSVFFFSIPIVGDRPFDPNDGAGPVLR